MPEGSRCSTVLAGVALHPFYDRGSVGIPGFTPTPFETRVQDCADLAADRRRRRPRSRRVDAPARAGRGAHRRDGAVSVCAQSARQLARLAVFLRYAAH